MKLFVFSVLISIGLLACDNFELTDVVNRDCNYPFLSYSSIDNMSTNVSTTPNIVLHFSTSMNKASVEQNVTLSRGGFTNVATSFYWFDNNNILSITPNEELLMHNPYSLTISRSAKSETGVMLTNNIVIRFSVARDTTPPQILLTTPLNNATNVLGRLKIIVFFNETMDTSSVGSEGSDGKSGAFALLDQTEKITGLISWAGCNLVFTPDEVLLPWKKYVIQISSNAMDMHNNYMASNHKASFIVRGKFKVQTLQDVNKYTLSYPKGLCSYSNNQQAYLFVCDSRKHRIVRYRKNEIVGLTSENWLVDKTWGGQGSGSGQFSNPFDIAIDSQANLFVADNFNHRVQKFDFNGTFITEWGSCGTGNGQFTHPRGIAIDSNDNVYIADSYGIQKFANNGNFIAKIRSYYNYNDWSFTIGLVITKEDYLYLTLSNDDGIWKMDLSGNVITNWDPHSRFVAMDIDSGGNMYCVSETWDSIYKFDSNCNQITNWIISNPKPLYESPAGIAIDHQDNIFVAVNNPDYIYASDSQGKIITEWGRDPVDPFSSSYISPSLVGVGPNNYIYYRFYDYTNNLCSYDQMMNPVVTWPMSYSPHRMAFFGSDIFVLSESHHYVMKIDSTGNMISSWGGHGSDLGKFDYPSGICFDSSGILYVADEDNNRVQSFSQDGNFLNSFSTGTVQPTAMGIDKYDNLYLLYYSQIYKYSTSGVMLTNWSFNATSSDTQMAVGRSGIIYVMTGSYHIAVYNGDGKKLTEFGSYGLGEYQFVGIADIVIGNNDELYVDTGLENGTKRMLIYSPISY